MLKGRLGLEKARIPHADRHGLLWLSRGELCVIDGCLHFLRGKDSLTPGIDQIPHQAVSMILLGPGSSVTHDALRLLARHGTLLAAVGEDGVRSYTAPPLLPDRSDVARRQAELWGNPRRRISVARHMYALRLGEVLPHRDLDTLRGIEGARVKAIYRLMAQKYGIDWEGRHYDRSNPNATDIPNQAINHAATAVQAAAAIAVGAPGPGRIVPAMAFAGAPRMHSGGWAGIKPDEVPAILQRGERVLSRREAAGYGQGQGAAPNISVTINARDAESFRQSRTQVAADIARAVSLGRRGM